MAGIQRRHIGKITSGLVEDVYGLAQYELDDEQLPLLSACQVLLYAKISGINGRELGGGLQYNLWANRPLGVRVQIYRIPDDETMVHPMPLFNEDQAAEIADRVLGVQRACALGFVGVSPDLTTVLGDTELPRIIEVPRHSQL